MTTSRHAELAERFGTPLYIYDLDEVEAARSELLAALPDTFDLFYALKANAHPDLVRALRTGPGRPCRPEISSTGELAAALAAGYTGADCLYTGPGKTPAELGIALSRGVRMFSTDSVGDVEHVAAAAREAGVVADCLLRVNSASASASTSIRMTGTPSQFGFDGENLPEAMPRLRAIDGIRLAGLHFFPLSNARDEEGLIDEFRHTIALAEELERDLALPLRYLDIGGGFSAPYGIPGSRSSYPKLAGELAAALDVHLPGWQAGAPRLACESGRFLAGCSGTLLTRVSNVKISRGRRFVILDAGINAFGGMSGIGRLLPVTVQTDDRATRTENGSLVGPLCTPGDVLGREVSLPADLAPGDLLAIPNTGAYGLTASLLGFLGRPAPAEVVVRGGTTVSASRLDLVRAEVTGPDKTRLAA